MSIQESYLALARLLWYPESLDESLKSCKTVASSLRARGVDFPAAGFEAFLQGSTLYGLQEDYVLNFDFNPKGCLYLGHHLHGDNQKKGPFMIAIKQEFGRHDFIQEGNELPDHLAVLLGFLAHLVLRGEDSYRRQFIVETVLPGLDKMTGTEPAPREPVWQSLVDTAERLCSADSKEVST